MKYSLDDWWIQLTIAEKERIAGKLFEGDNKYPRCTVHWNALSDEIKQKIHDNVTEQNHKQNNNNNITLYAQVQ